MTYTEKYLTKPLGKLGTGESGTVTLSRKKTKYGWKIVQGTNYISIITTKLYIYEDGFAKSVTVVDKNYHAKYSFTCYYDNNGKEIVIEHVLNQTRAELTLWKKLRGK